MKRLVWHDREPWFYTYNEGGFEGYIALFSRRRLAPDLPRYVRRLCLFCWLRRVHTHEANRTCWDGRHEPDMTRWVLTSPGGMFGPDGVVPTTLNPCKHCRVWLPTFKVTVSGVEDYMQWNGTVR